MRHNAQVDLTLQFLVTAIAAGASLTAVLLGIDQLSSGARLRNLEAVLRAAVATPDGTERDEVVVSLHRTTLGRLIAREAVPFRAFLVPSVILVVPLTSTVRVAFLTALPWWLGGLFAVGCGGVMGVGLRQLIYLMGERVRIRSWFEQGLIPLRAFTDFMARMTGGPRRLVRLAYAEGIVGSVCIYFLLRALNLPPTSALGVTMAALFCVAASVLALLNVMTVGIVTGNLTFLPSRRFRLGPSWVHPSTTTSSSVASAPGQIDQPSDNLGQTQGGATNDSDRTVGDQ